MGSGDMKRTSLAVLFISTLWAFTAANASEFIRDGVVLAAGSAEEGFVLDPATGDYTLTYKTTDLDGKEFLYQIVFVPATKIKPKLKSKFKVTETGTIRYGYKIKNRKRAKQSLDSVMVMTTSVVDTTVTAPDGWRGSAHSITGYLGSDTNETGFLGINVAWHPLSGDSHKEIGITPGSSLAGFDYESNDLPGIGVAKLSGNVGKVLGLAGEGPQGELGEQFHELSVEQNHVPRHTAVSKIQVPEPFDATTVLGSIQKHVQELVTMELVEPVFAGQLDALFAAATEALGRDDAESALSHLKDLRQMIQQARHEAKQHNKQEKKDKKKSGQDDGEWDKDEEQAGRDRPITRLAARVLRFDVKYVSKRLRQELKD